MSFETCDKQQLIQSLRKPTVQPCLFLLGNGCVSAVLLVNSASRDSASKDKWLIYKGPLVTFVWRYSNLQIIIIYSSARVVAELEAMEAAQDSTAGSHFCSLVIHAFSQWSRSVFLMPLPSITSKTKVVLSRVNMRYKYSEFRFNTLEQLR